MNTNEIPDGETKEDGPSLDTVKIEDTEERTKDTKKNDTNEKISEKNEKLKEMNSPLEAEKKGTSTLSLSEKEDKEDNAKKQESEKARITNITTPKTNTANTTHINDEKDEKDKNKKEDEMDIHSESSKYSENGSDNETESEDDTDTKSTKDLGKEVKKEDEEPVKKRKRRKTRNDLIPTPTKRPRKYTKRESIVSSSTDVLETDPFNIIKYPPLTSPGLLLNANVITTPSYVFQESLDDVGYTEKYRVRNSANHKTGTFRKEVGDMFDSNVILNNVNIDQVLMDRTFVNSQQCDDFMQELNQYAQEGKESYEDCENRVQFQDMLPMSLITNYPQSYKDELELYTRRVLEREEVIRYNVSFNLDKKKGGIVVVKEEMKEEMNTSNDVGTTASDNTNHESKATTTGDTEGSLTYTASDKPTKELPQSKVMTPTQTDNASEKPTLKEVPPIPEPPTIPEMSHTTTSEDEIDNDNTSTAANDNVLSYRYTAHLDPACFFPTMRYYSLSSNNVADPYFVGPNAPGITSSTSNVGQHAFATINSTTGLTNSHLSKSSKKLATATPILLPSNIKNLPLFINKNQSKASTLNAPSCTKTIADLRTIMEVQKDPGIIQQMKECIILSSIDLAKQEEEKTLLNPNLARDKKIFYAANIVQYPFKGPDDEIYPDVIRAFALYCDVKPCKKCKGNKQGSFHCRMRRKHDAVDYDGGDSYRVLEEVKMKYNLHSVDKVN